MLGRTSTTLFPSNMSLLPSVMVTKACRSFANTDLNSARGIPVLILCDTHSHFFRITSSASLLSDVSYMVFFNPSNSKPKISIFKAHIALSFLSFFSKIGPFSSVASERNTL